jgi:hypothetical protein
MKYPIGTNLVSPGGFQYTVIAITPTGTTQYYILEDTINPHIDWKSGLIKASVSIVDVEWRIHDRDIVVRESTLRTLVADLNTMIDCENYDICKRLTNTIKDLLK